VTEDKRKDLWDKIGAVTPLILGIAVTGVGALFTQVYNFRQLQLNQIEALEKLRPLLTSEKPEEREFGYASFAALGYEDIAIRIVKLKKDPSGRPLLVELQKAGSAQVQAQATDALRSLDAAQKLVNIAEYGKAQPDEAQLEAMPIEKMVPYALWAQKTAQEIGVNSKLGVAALYDAAVQLGQGRTRRLADSASAAVPPPLGTREKEAAWIKAFLDQREEAAKQGPLARFYPQVKRRIDRLRDLLAQGDLDLATVPTAEAASRAERGASP
jgi:hypothetical protein